MCQRLVILSLVTLIAATGCQTTGRNSTATDGPAPRFSGIGDHHYAITTTSPRAQQYFDQGLTWAYAFNHDEAIRSFKEVARLDPDCAMAWWGVALCNGPHINNPAVAPENAAAAWDAVQKAQALKAKAGAKEQALIDAVAARYAMPHPDDRRALDEAYMAAMAKVYKAYPDDADIATLYAESMMDLQPWDMWTKDGQPRGKNPEILAVIDRALALNPDHPGANHLMIHAVEAGPNPERGEAAADRLRDLVPISGHLVHMPSHIDVQTGKWSLASDQNMKAIEADRKYRRISPNQGFYHLYMAHDHHFLAFACMMEARQKVALRAARDMIAGVPDEFFATSAAVVDPYMAIEYDVLKRFGRWEELLKTPAPRPDLPLTTCLWRASRGVALAALDRVAEAEKEHAAFREAVARVPAGAMMAINPAEKVLKIADHVVLGEIAYRKGEIDVAVQHLRQAADLEDQLIYMEPPDWIQPVRHTLGAVLVSAGRYDEAAKVYQEDLAHWPENGWSLFGLWQCLRDQGDSAAAADMEKRWRKAWKRSDVKVGSSCLCVAGDKRS
jgi:tetratricopeptide (TPR) repeat protein